MDMATIYDVAREAGVSISSVSRALQRPEMVREELREYIVGIASQMGYRPNRLARSLAEGRSRSIGLLLPPEEGNPYFLRVVGAVRSACDAAGYDLYTGTYPDTEVESYLQAAVALQELQADGFLLYGGPDQANAFVELDGGTAAPIVLLGSGPVVGMACVGPNEIEAGRLATEHLIDLGHDDIAFLGFASSDNEWRREYGYRRGMIAAGLEPLLLMGPSTLEFGRSAARQIANSMTNVTAIIAHNDIVAIGALRGLHELGVPVPERMSVMGFDDLLMDSHLVPSLSSVDMVGEEVGLTAARLLLDALEAGGQPVEPEQHLLHPRLVLRESVGQPF